MTRVKIILLSLLLTGFASASQGQGAEIVLSLVNTEKEFAWTVQEEGIRKGFIQYLDRQGLVFEPSAMNGRDHYRKQETDSAGLIWFPASAEVNDDGLLGYTTGPFEYRNSILDTEPSRTGHYVSIWRRKNSRDKWEMILNIRIPHPPAETTRRIWYGQPVSGKVPITPAYELVKSKQILLDSDELFNVSLKAGRLEFGYNEFYADSVRLYREGHAPFAGKQAATKHLLQKQGKYTYNTSDGYVSQVREIAYTFGTGFYYENIRTSRSDQTFSYVRIWKKGPTGLWKVILDIEKSFEQTSTE